jgi:lipopolysaccharide transport system ATP-binding protein
MSSHFVIEVEQVGKRFTVNEERPGGKLVEKLGNLFRRRDDGRRVFANQPEEIWALKDVTFGVEQGQVVGIIGRNGSGKSTLLKILSRITAPTEGYARISGRVGSLLEVGTGFHPDLSGRENIFLNGAVLGMTRKETARRLDEIIAFSEVEAFIDTPVKHYSSGMFMRLAFSVAAHFDAEIMLVDEVLAVGDQAFQAKCLAKIREIVQADRTVLFVGHDMKSIQNLCDRAIVLDKGRLVLQGSPKECVNRYEAICRDASARSTVVRQDRSDGSSSSAVEAGS